MFYTFVFSFCSFFFVDFFFFFFYKRKNAAYVNIYTIPFQDNKLSVSSDSGHER